MRSRSFETLELCKELKNKFAPDSYIRFVINPRLKRSLGRCRYQRLSINPLKFCTIELSYTHVNVADPIHVRHTILHELAHALTLGEKHNHVWRTKFHELLSQDDIFRQLPDNPLYLVKRLAPKVINNIPLEVASNASHI
jgi:hypothetical protein